MNISEYNSIVRQWSPHLLRFANRNLNNLDLAKDVVQDTFLALWNNRQQFDNTKAKQYLFTIAYRKCMDVFRKVKNESELNEQHESITDTVHFENSFMNKELLKTALERIPEMQRTLILLRDLEGYNYKEIEEITGLNESQVKVYLFRARKILKETITAMEAI